MAKQIRIIKGSVTSGPGYEGYPIQTIFTVTAGRTAKVHIPWMYNYTGNFSRLWVTGMSTSYPWTIPGGNIPGAGGGSFTYMPSPSPDVNLTGNYIVPRVFYMNSGESLYYQNMYYSYGSTLWYNICVIEEY